MNMWVAYWFIQIAMSGNFTYLLNVVCHFAFKEVKEWKELYYLISVVIGLPTLHLTIKTQSIFGKENLLPT